MDYLQKFVGQFRERLFILLLVNNVILTADLWLADQVFKLTGYWLIAALVLVPLLTLTFSAWFSARYLTQPTKLLWQAILHILPESHDIPAPKLETAYFGHEMVSNLANDVYKLAIDGARLAASADQAASDIHHNEVVTKLPLPLLILDAKATITYANPAALAYLKVAENEVTGKNFYTLLDLSFSDNNTLDSWLKNVQGHSVSAVSSWHHVRTTLASNQTLQFDLAASYSQADPAGNELIVALFDRTAVYEQDDQSLDFIALAVHELRTPLSLLMDYVELFEDELGDQLNPEMTRFMQQMKSSGQKLAAFFTNILTVARIESNQLELKLTEQNWGTIVKQAVNEMHLRAQVYGLELELTIDSNLPDVGANPATANEVIVNLIDNAIKYSPHTPGKKIIVHTGLNQEGLVETTVQDFGVGIPASIIPNLFEKFSRNFHNRMNVSGTGLGLYLSRLIVEAHGGHIWVRSLEGKGATFGFTVQPFAMLATELKNSNNTDITHSAHGWVKNHSLYRS